MGKYNVEMSGGAVYTVEVDDALPDAAQRAQAQAAHMHAQQASKPTPVIKNPPGFLDQAGAFLRESVPVVTGTLGGALGAPLGPFGAVAGGALGYAGGRQAVEAAEALGGKKLDRPEPTFAQRTGGAVHDLLTGATMEAGGQAAAAVPGAVLRGARGLVGVKPVATGEDMAVREAAARQGIKIPASVASGSRSAAMLETAPSRYPIGGSGVEELSEVTRRGAERAVNRTAANQGVSVTPDVAGRSIKTHLAGVGDAQTAAAAETVDRAIAGFGGQAHAGQRPLGAALKESLRAGEKARRKAAKDMYDDAMAVGDPAATLPLPSTRATVTEISKREARLTGVEDKALSNTAGGLRAGTEKKLDVGELPPEAMRELLRKGALGPEGLNAQRIPQDFAERYGLSQDKPRTLADVVDIQKRLKSLIRSEKDDYTRRELRKIADAVTDDIEAFAAAQGNDFGNKLAAANTFYRDEVASLFASKAPLRKLLDSEPGKVADRVLNAAGPDDLYALTRGLGADARRDLQRAVVQKWRDRATQNGVFNPQAFVDEVTKYGDENTRIVFGPRAGEVKNLVTSLQRGFGPQAASPELGRVAAAPAETLVAGLTSGRVRDINKFDQVWTTLTPEIQQETRSALLNDLAAQALDPQTGKFSPMRFQTAKGKIPEPLWERILTTATKKDMDDLATVFRRWIDVDRGAANPSGTGHALVSAGQVVGGVGSVGKLAYDAATGQSDLESTSKASGALLLTLLAPRIAARMTTGKWGQRFLTSPAPQAMQPPKLLHGRISGTGTAIRGLIERGVRRDDQ